MDQDCSSINYGPDIGINHVTKFCANHTNDLYDDHKTIDTIIVPHSGDANFHRICLDNQDLSITNDNDKQVQLMMIRTLSQFDQLIFINSALFLLI